MNGAAKVMVVVPARGGSKRLPGKNLMLVGDRSLLQRTADFLASEGLLGCSILSTDDHEIAASGASIGLRVPFMRPLELASDTASSTDVLKHALAWWRENVGEPDLVALVQVTTPFRRKGLMTDALRVLDQRPEVNAVIAMSRLGVPFNCVFQARADQTVAAPFGSSASPWIPTGAIYVTRTKAFETASSLYADPIVPIETEGIEAIDIDEDIDLILARVVSA